jgi:hypothetical protein
MSSATGVIVMTITTPSVVSPPPAPSAVPRRAWLVVLVISGVALGLAAGMVIGRQSSTPQDPPALAGPTITAMLTARVAAINEGTAEEIAGFYTADAVLEEHDQHPAVLTTGGAAIGEHLNTYRHLGLRIAQAGTTIALGPFVAEPLLWSPGDGGIAVYRLADDGRIAHQWVMGAPIPGAAGP